MNTPSSKLSSSNTSSAISAELPSPLSDSAHYEQLVIGKAARPKPHRLLPLLCFTLVLSAGTYLVIRHSRINTDLRLAVMQHDAAQVSRLLAWGADPNLRYDGQSSNDTSLWSGLFSGSAHRLPANLYRTHKTLLMSAVSAGHADIVAALLTHGADVNAQLPNGQTPLLFASANHFPTIAPMLLARGANWNVRDNQGRTPFLNAAEGGNIETVRAILDKGGNIEETDADQQSALCLASANRHEDVVELLLQRGARVDSLTNALINPSQYHKQHNWNGYMPPRPQQMPILHWAAEVGSPSLVTAIWDKHLTENERTQYGIAALNLAVQSGSEATVRALLARNVPVEPATAWCFTPLTNAAGVHDLAIMRLLLDRGAHVNPFPGQHVRTPLMGAASNSVMSSMITSSMLQQQRSVRTIISLLLDLGANVNAQDDQGKTPLMYASNSYDATRILLEHGANVNTRDKQNNTAIFQANDFNVTKLLLEHGASAHDADRSGNPLLMRVGDPDLCAFLIAKGADVNACDTFGATPLMRTMSDKFATLLLSHGANVNAHDKQGDTALHQTVRMNQMPIVTVLIQHGADVNVVNNRGETPLFIAKQSRQQKMIDLLTAAGATH